MISPNPASIARIGLVLLLQLTGLPLCAQMDLSGDWGATTNSVPALQLFFPGAGRQDGQVAFIGTLAGFGGAIQLPFNEVQNRFTGADDITWTHGAHMVKLGASVSRVQTNTYMPFRIGSTWTFAGLTGFSAGQPTALSFTPLVIPAGLPGAGPSYGNRDLRDLEFTPYAQDDWKVSQKLTLNMGVRWSSITNPYDVRDCQLCDGN